VTSIAQKAGFGGGIVVDYPNSKKAKKIFLCLMVGSGGVSPQIPKGLEGDGDVENVKFEKRRISQRRRDKDGKRKSVKDRDWILKKKEVARGLATFASTKALMTVIVQLYRARGKEGVPHDSKYTGRRRRIAF
jgi:18S rRNA (guanine1575-N7)-methyltransferase